MATRKWTKEQREKQRQLIQKWQPWEKSTGPKTSQGKNKSSQNAKFETYYDNDEFTRRVKEAKESGGRFKIRLIQNFKNG